MTNFIIFCIPRTGSTLLRSALDLHPNLTCAAEVFAVHCNNRPDAFQNLFEISVIKQECGQTDHVLNTVDLDFRPYIDILFSSYNGFKLISSHIDLQSNAWEKLTQPHIKYIFLERNTLDAFCSFKLAEASGVWHLTKGRSPINDVQIELNLENYRWFESYYSSPYNYIKNKISNEFIVIQYSDMVENWDETFAKLCNFLEIEKCVIEMPTAKRSGRFEDTIINYKELKRNLLTII